MSRHLSRMAWKQASTVSRPKRVKQPLHAACAHDAGLHLAVEIGREHFGHAGVALDDGEHRVVAHARAVELDRRDREAFLEHRGRGSRHRARHAAADVVVVAERLDVGDDLAIVEYRHRAAEVGQVTDAALGQIGVVHQEHVARPHGLGRKVAHHGVRHGRIGAAGELAAIAVEQADAIVVRLADHRPARGALDGVFDLGLDRIQRALDDLQHDRIDVARRRRAPKASPSQTSGAGSSNAFRFRLRGTNDQDAVRVDLEMLSGKDHGGRAELLHDRRPFEPKTRRQHRAVVDRRVAERAVEIDRADGLARRRRGAARGKLRVCPAARSARSRRRRN